MISDKSTCATKKSYIVIFATLCTIISLVFAVIEAISFYLYLESGGLNSTAGAVWCHVFFAFLAVGEISVIFVFVSLILTIAKRKMFNVIATIVGILSLICGWGLNIYSSHGFSFDTTRIESIRHFAHNSLALEDLRWLKKLLPQYAQQHDGQLPPLENWCGALAQLDSNKIGGEFRPKQSQSKIRYAFNKNLIGMRLADVPKDAVLLFETTPSKNPIGDKESLSTALHYDKGCIILFGDLQIKFVKTGDITNLRWKP